MAITKTKSGNYKIQFQFSGKTYIKTVGTKKSDALAYEAKWLAELRNEELFGKVKTTTFVDALKSYTDKRKSLNSYKNLLSVQTRLIKHFGEELMLHNLDTEKVWEFDSLLEAEGLLKSTRVFYFTVIQAVINMAEKLGYKVSRIEKPHMPKSKQRNTIFSKEEELALYEALNPDNHKILSNKKDALTAQRLVKLLFQFGARYSEILKLTWDQVDLDNRVITLHRTKVDNRSVLAMSDIAFEVFTSMANDSDKHDTWVFPHKNGKGPRIHPSPAIRNAMNTIGCNDKTVHDIRRTVASRLVRAGMSIQGVQKVLGHANITQTANAYAWLDNTQVQKEMVDILNNI